VKLLKKTGTAGSQVKATPLPWSELEVEEQSDELEGGVLKANIRMSGGGSAGRLPRQREDRPASPFSVRSGRRGAVGGHRLPLLHEKESG
jgi:hypothetical protein